MNKICLIGRLVREPVLSALNNNHNCSFSYNSLAVSRNYKDKDGKTPCDFIPVRFYGTSADTASKYLQKGSKIAVTGSLITTSYTPKDNPNTTVNAFYVLVERFEFLEPINKNNNYNYMQEEQQPKQASVFDNPLGEPLAFDEDALPF